jgi:hypothetical protein
MSPSPRPWTRPLLSLVAVALGGCSPAEPAPSVSPQPPWEEAVAGAVAVTAWQDEGEPTAPFGPGGFPWETPEQLLESMASSLASASNARTSAAVVERRADGSTIGWVRIELPEPGAEAAIGIDLRLTMRREDGSWFVALTETREHCARPLAGGSCH